MSEPTPQPESTPTPEPAAELPPVPGAEGDSSSAMLAELDALLERMMALPVSQVEEGNTPVRRTETPPEDIPIITVTEAVAPAAPAHPAEPPVFRAPDDLYFRTMLAEQSAEPIPAPEPTRPPEPMAIHRPSPEPEEFPVPRATSEPAPSSIRTDPLPPPSRWLKPLVWFNQGFDGVVARLGRPGRWLTGERGRSVLGWSGMVMLLALAGLVVCDCLGWTW